MVPVIDGYPLGGMHDGTMHIDAVPAASIRVRCAFGVKAAHNLKYTFNRLNYFSIL